MDKRPKKLVIRLNGKKQANRWSGASVRLAPMPHDASKTTFIARYQNKPNAETWKTMPATVHITDTRGSEACNNVLGNTDLLEMNLLRVAETQSCPNLCALLVSRRTSKAFRDCFSISSKLQRALWLQPDLNYQPSHLPDPPHIATSEAISEIQLNPMLAHIWSRPDTQFMTVDIWDSETETWHCNSSQFPAILDASGYIGFISASLMLRVPSWTAKHATGGHGSWRRMQIFRSTRPGIDLYVGNESKYFGKFRCATAETVDQMLKKVKRELGHCECGISWNHGQEECQTGKSITA